MVEDGAIEPEAAKADWVHFLSDVLSGKVAAEELDHLQERIAAFTGSHTKAELLAGALERRVLMAPVATVPELLASDQLSARGYWEEVDGVRYPGPFAIAAAVGPAWRRSAPARNWASTPPRCSTPCPSARPRPARGRESQRIDVESPRSVDSEPRRPPAAGPARRRQGRRPDLVHGRTGHHPDDGRLGGHRRAGRVRQPARRRAGFGPLPPREVRPRRRRLRADAQLRQAGPGARLVEARLAAGARGPAALGRRGRRQLQPPRHPQPAPRLGDPVGAQPPADPGEHLPDGPVRPAGRVRRVREPLRRRGRLLRGRRLARPPAGRAPTSPTPTWSRPASRSARSSPRSTSGAAPAAVATSTSPRPRRRCGCSPPTSSTTS